MRQGFEETWQGSRRHDRWAGAATDEQASALSHQRRRQFDELEHPFYSGDMNPRQAMPPRQPWRFLLVMLGLAVAARILRPTAPTAPEGASGTGPPGQASPSPAPRGQFPRSGDLLLQDAELVFGAEDARFDAAALIAANQEHFGTRSDLAGLATRIGVEHSVSPRLLLALLALDGPLEPGAVPPYLQQEAAWLADGYYGLKYRDDVQVRFADGSSTEVDRRAGAAHVAVARNLARRAGPSDWETRRRAFAARYGALFGEQAWQAPPLPEGLQQPALLLPWSEGTTWHYTGGPHGAWGIASAWGAVDFAPPTQVGCGVAPEWVLASAPGLIVHSADGLVLLDLDGDGNPGTGWVLAYLHLATHDRIQVGQSVAAGDPMGHPSCEGGVADGAHVHLARRYNGEWLPAADGPAPLELSGWRFRSLGGEYDGAMEHPEAGTRMAVTSRRGGDSSVRSDNGPLQRAAQAAGLTVGAANGADGRGTSGAAAPPAMAGAATNLPLSPTQVSGATPRPPVSMAAAPGPAATGAASTFRIRLPLDGRDGRHLAATVQIWRDGIVIASHSLPLDALGFSASMPAPAPGGGPVDVVVSLPGHLPQSMFGVRLEDLPTLDFSLGGIVRAPAGDVDGNGRIGLADLAAWNGRRSGAGAAADLSGDGDVDTGDLWRLLGALARRR